jgi:hypothetical protein
LHKIIRISERSTHVASKSSSSNSELYASLAEELIQISRLLLVVRGFLRDINLVLRGNLADTAQWTCIGTDVRTFEHRVNLQLHYYIL